ncbi:MAG: 50S ribosomal protein L9 [Chitinophagia bacterium]|nr:50S ribosomal protein L9 [Chitinophagia bacterium]
MQIILIKDVDNLGATHEIVEVRSGYARNFLIPQKMALEASPANLKIAEERRKHLQKKLDKVMAEIAEVTARLKESPVKVGAKIGISGKIFGSVTSIQLARAIREQKGYEIDRRVITIVGDIKEAGIHKAELDLGKNNVIEIEFEVVGE